jgi:hypothetical protein
MTERVHIRGTVVEDDHEALVVETSTATYHYDMEGGGFSSLLDRDGRDWIGYRPGDGPAGEYRGIPNMVFRGEAGGFFHPGHTGDMGSVTQLVAESPEAVTLKTTSANGLWQVQWDIYPGHARMRVLRTNPDDGAYWFLYEGTPGGAFEPERSLCVRCTRESTPLSEPWEADLPSPAWVAFTDPQRRRSLFLYSEKPSRGPDMYKPMEPMTVFGFGRRIEGVRPHITDVGNAFYIGLVESAEYAAVARTVSALR